MTTASPFAPEKSQFGSGMTLHRRAAGAGLDVYLCTYAETSGRRAGAVDAELEIGVDLSGGWMIRSRRTPERTCLPGELYVLDSAEPYDNAYAAGAQHGQIVMFAIHPRRFFGDEGADQELVFAPGVRRDQALLELAQGVRRACERGENLPAEVPSALRTFLSRHCEITSQAPIVRGRKLLEETFGSDLYLEHLAAEVGMHPVTFLRRFERRYGLTPIQYRIKLRLNEAARTAWREPTLALHEIAERCGFTHLPYFHRSYRRYFGTTPATHRRAGAEGSAAQPSVRSASRA